RGRSDGITAVLGEKAHQASAMLEVGYVAVEIEPVQGLELESDVALEKIADVRWSIHATRVGQRWQCAISSMRQVTYSSSASKRPLRSQRRIIPEPSLVGLRRSFVVQIRRQWHLARRSKHYFPATLSGLLKNSVRLGCDNGPQTRILSTLPVSSNEPKPIPPDP